VTAHFAVLREQLTRARPRAGVAERCGGARRAFAEILAACHSQWASAFTLQMSLSEHEQLRRLARGSPEAFDALYALYARRVMRFLQHLTHDPVLAEDVFQETWLKLANAAASLAVDTQVLAWLLRVARNDWLSRLRKERRLTPLDEPELEVDLGPQPDQQLEVAQSTAALLNALQRLAVSDRELLLLVAVEGLDQEQAALVVGVSKVALRQRLSRARARLTLLLAAAGKDNMRLVTAESSAVLKGIGR
jgi:RNA polymerase sigma-70 factor (ECF subfamily)